MPPPTTKWGAEGSDNRALQSMWAPPTGDDLCPVAALLAYAAIQDETPGPFFRFGDGTPLAKARFVLGVWAAPERADIPCRQYSGHSFRIGAATTAAERGMQDSTIQVEDGSAWHS